MRLFLFVTTFASDDASFVDYRLPLQKAVFLGDIISLHVFVNTSLAACLFILSLPNEMSASPHSRVLGVSAAGAYMAVIPLCCWWPSAS